MSWWSWVVRILINFCEFHYVLMNLVLAYNYSLNLVLDFVSSFDLVLDFVTSFYLVLDFVTSFNLVSDYVPNLNILNSSKYLQLFNPKFSQLKTTLARDHFWEFQNKLNIFFMYIKKFIPYIAKFSLTSSLSLA